MRAAAGRARWGAGALAAAAVLCLLLARPSAARADVRLDVRTDRTSLTLDDTLTLQISVQSQGGGSPRIDLPQLDGFQVVSQQVQRPMQFSFNFGAQAMVQSSTIYTFVLQPLRRGTLVIKPVRVELDGKVQTSRPIQITVGAGASAPPSVPDQSAPQGQAPAASDSSGSGDTQVDPIAFVRTVADKPEPFVGEQVTITFYLYVRERLQSSPNVETEPSTDGLWTQDLLPPGRTLQPVRQVVGGSLYTVYVLKRLAGFPLHAGDVTIGAMSLEIDTSSLFDIFAPTRGNPNLKRSSQPVVLHVKPLPDAGRPPGEVAVGRYHVTAKLDRAQAVTGDAVTLIATVQGEGDIRSVQLAAPAVSGVDVLQPETKDLIEAPNDLVGGTREYRWLLVPRKPGRVTVPPLTLSTFDPSTQKYGQLSSSPLSLQVVGQALPSAQAAGTPESSSTGHEPAETQPEPHHWAPIHTQSALWRGYTRVVERPWYPWALAAPALLWLAVVSAAGARRRLAARALSGTGRVLREAEQHLREAEAAAREGVAARFHAEASAALVTLLEARLEETLSGLTRPELRARLQARGMDQAMLGEALGALEHHEFTRFSAGGAAGGALEGEAGALRALYKRLAGFEPNAVGVAA